MGLDLTHRLRILLFTPSNGQGKAFSYPPPYLERVNGLEGLGAGSGIVKYDVDSVKRQSRSADPGDFGKGRPSCLKTQVTR